MGVCFRLSLPLLLSCLMFGIIYVHMRDTTLSAYNDSLVSHAISGRTVSVSHRLQLWLALTSFAGRVPCFVVLMFMHSSVPSGNFPRAALVFLLSPPLPPPVPFCWDALSASVAGFA